MNAIVPKSSRKELGAKRRAARKELLLDLANLRDDGLAYFHKKWKHLYELYKDEDVFARRDELRLLWMKRLYQETHRWEEMKDMYSKIPNDEPDESPLRRELRRQWNESHHAVELPITDRNKKLYDEWDELGEGHLGPLEQYICDHWLSLKGVRFEVEWTVNRKVVGTTGRRLPPHLVLACLHLADRFGFCRNPSCPAPYILASRRDQLYCSDVCAGPAKKAAKLRWWHDNRGKKSKMRKRRRK